MALHTNAQAGHGNTVPRTPRNGDPVWLYSAVAVCRTCQGIAVMDEDGWPFGAVCPCGGKFSVAATGAAILADQGKE